MVLLKTHTQNKLYYIRIHPIICKQQYSICKYLQTEIIQLICRFLPQSNKTEVWRYYIITFEENVANSVKLRYTSFEYDCDSADMYNYFINFGYLVTIGHVQCCLLYFILMTGRKTVLQQWQMSLWHHVICLTDSVNYPSVWLTASPTHLFCW